MIEYDLIIIGSGPGGYVAGIRAGQLGMKVAVVEKDSLGGVCLNWGCIPSKALLRNAEIVRLIHRADEFGITFDKVSYDYSKAVDRSRQVVTRLVKGIEALFKKNKVELIKGEAVLKNKNTIEIKGSGQTLSTKNIIVATGARARSLPSVQPDGKTVITSREALELREAPKSIAIIGGGAVGVEFGYLFKAYGSDVTIVELLPRLVPLEDEEVSKLLERSFSKQGIVFKTNSQVTNTTISGHKVILKIATSKGEESLTVDKVLLCVGVQGNVEGLGLEATGVLIEKGFIKVNDNMQTSVPGIYAIGDVTGKVLLAHVASAQGVAAVEAIAGIENPPLNYTYMPKATYCHPQVASFGLTEAQAKEKGYKVKVGKFPFIASGKALALGETDGMVKVVVDEEVGEILGAHMIGSEVTELLGEISLAKLLEGTTNELGWLVHPHPSISEALKEAALAADGKAIHI